MSIIDGIAKRYFKNHFGKICRSIRDTPPIHTDPTASFVVVSQCYINDLDMFLVAAKTFSSFVRPRQFIIVDDGLGEVARFIISFHLGAVAYIPRWQVANEICPAGGCWERLLVIADASPETYVVQLDSDTVTCSRPNTVIDAIASNRSFTLSTKNGQEIVSVLTASNFAKSIHGEHVQLVAERALTGLSDSDQLYYIRGCAGFTGFARGSISRIAVESLSASMTKLVGRDVWRQWGSEQFASNFCIANDENPVPLPFQKYPYWKKSTDISEAEFIHFIGSDRFTGPKYANVVSSVMRRLLTYKEHKRSL
jgi:hypothetical protein